MELHRRVSWNEEIESALGRIDFSPCNEGIVLDFHDVDREWRVRSGSHKDRSSVISNGQIEGRAQDAFIRLFRCYVHRVERARRNGQRLRRRIEIYRHSIASEIQIR